MIDDIDRKDEYAEVLERRRKRLEEFNRTHDSSRLNIFSRIMFSIAKFFIRLGYDVVSKVIDEDNIEEADGVVNAIVRKKKKFRPNEAVDELLDDPNRKGHRVLHFLILVIDAVIALSALAVLGYGGWMYYTM